jgi:ribosomal protein S18 acetylase RimI-like enzyme
MSSTASIRPFTPDDLAPVVELWNRCLPKDPLRIERFWRLFVLDPNFDTAGFLVAVGESGQIVGALQAMTRKVPLGSLGTQPETGWLTAFFVHPNHRRLGVGTRLLEAGLAYLRASGRTKVLCNGYAPYYLFPGVDVEYAEAHAFLERHGFAAVSEPVAMGMALESVVTPEAVAARAEALRAAGVTVRRFDLRDTLLLLDFAETHFPHWRPSILEGLQQGNTEIVIADDNGEIIAFAQWENPHNDPPGGVAGRFGPFGVHPERRSGGIGAVVFYDLIARVKAKGTRYLWFGWAGGRNLSFYERAGCVVTRRFLLYQRSL